MKVRSFLIIGFLLVAFGSNAQQEEPAFYHIYFNPGIGYNIPLSSFYTGEITDNLISYEDHSYYWQIISGAVFIDKHWGGEFSYQSNGGTSSKVKAALFTNELERNYQERYFINTEVQPFDSLPKPLGEVYKRGLLGIVYRYETRKILLMPKLCIGVTSFNTKRATSILKEKGYHAFFDLTYNPEDYHENVFTFGCQIVAGYKFSKQIAFAVHLQYSFCKPNFSYTESLQNVFTNETKDRRITYNNSIQNFSLGVELIYQVFADFNLH